MTSPRGVTTSTSTGSGSIGPRTMTPGLRSLAFISSNSKRFGSSLTKYSRSVACRQESAGRRDASAPRGPIGSLPSIRANLLHDRDGLRFPNLASHRARPRARWTHPTAPCEVATPHWTHATPQWAHATPQWVHATAHCEVATAHCEVTTPHWTHATPRGTHATARCEVATAHCEVAEPDCEVTTARCEVSMTGCEIATTRCEASTSRCKVSTSRCEVATSRCEDPTSSDEVSASRRECPIRRWVRPT
jgi:hypothetical protein